MQKFKNKYQPGDIQSMIMTVFSVVSAIILLFVCVVMYWKFFDISQENILDNNQKIMDQAVESVENYLISMRQVSDAVYYDVLKENDILSQSDTIHNGMKLLYEANKQNLRSIAIYNQSGSLIAAEPVVLQKEEPNVTRQGWFIDAMDRMENIHFSTPHIQNLFDDGTMRYYRVISSSRAVEITDGTNNQLGVLLVDMDYSGIARMMEQINTAGNGQYFYLCDRDGEIIYHPHQMQLEHGGQNETNQRAAASKDKVYDEYDGGRHRKVIVNTISYTGWKLVCVMPYSIFVNKMADVNQFVFILMLLVAMMIVFVNRVVSSKISKPIMKLNDPVTKYEEGKESDIYIGGASEIRHLGMSIQESYRQNSALMQKGVWEQNE